MTDQAEGQSPEDQMLALLEREEQAEQAEPQEDQPEEQTETQDVEEESVEEESQPEPTKLKLKWNGEEVEKDLDEVISLAQQGHDYTKKTQAIAEERKAIEEKAQAIKAQEQAHQEQVQMHQALIKEIAEATALDKQIAQFNNVDWPTLIEQDHIQAQKLMMQRTNLVEARNRVAQELNQKSLMLAKQQQTRVTELKSKAKAELIKSLPDWNEAKEGEAKSIAMEYGFSADEFSSVIDARTMKLILDAGAFRKLQAKPAIKNKVAGKPPVVKPGSKDPGAAQNSQRAELQKQLKRSGRLEDAAALIEQTL